MKFLILVREASRRRDGSLSKSGEKMIEKLAKKLKPFTDGEDIRILSSTAKAAYESAESLFGFLSAREMTIESHDVLWSGNGRPMNKLSVLNLVREHQDSTDIIILVTHAKYVQHFPSYFLEEELKEHTPMQYLVEKGEAVIVDIADQTQIYLDLDDDEDAQ